MAIGVTNQDKKKARNTVIVMSVLLTFFTLLTIIFGVLIPVSKEIQTLGNNEEIKELVEGKTGDDYFLLSDTAMYRFDSFTNEQLSVFQTSEIKNVLEKNGDLDKVLANSFNHWSAKYVAGKNGEDYFLLIDSNGNIFKCIDDGVSLSVTNDYFLANATTGKLEVKAYEELETTLYVLLLQTDSSYYIYRFDIENLSAGASKQKRLWDWDLDGATATTRKIVPLTTAKTGVLNFTVTDQGIYLFKNSGGVVRLGLGLADYIDENGEEFDYMNVVSSYYEQGKDKIVEEQAFIACMKELILSHKKNTYLAEDLNGKTREELSAIYKSIASTSEYTKGNKKANDEAKAAVNETFVAENPWCESYDTATRTLRIDMQYVTPECYSVLYAGDANIAGIVYSKKNRTIYYSNVLDGYLYAVEQSALDQAANDAFLSDYAVKISSVDIGDKSFSTFGNGLALNKFANTLYLRYKNDQTVSIVDLNDKNDYKILSSFEANFDITVLTGDKDNKVTHALRQVTSVDLQAKTTNCLYSDLYQPEQFANKALMRLLFIIFLVLAVIALGLDIWFIVAVKDERALYKLKEIQKDLKKNKFVYLVLSFFIILLFMFCYYEAVGAISMSFFDYTQEKPAWIWNDFGNYIKVLNESSFWLSIGNMLFFLVFDLILCLAPPLVFAFLLILIRNKTASNWIRALMFIPSIIPSMATMLIWRTGIYGNSGILNQLIGAEVPIEFLTNTDYARWALIFMGFPFVGGYLIFYGGMMNIPGEYHEAGRLEGLGIVKRFFMIDIPLIMPQIKYIFIMTFISSVQNYARTYILASTGTTTPVETMYTTMMIHGDYGKSSAYATLIFLFLFAAVATNFKMQKKETMGEDL